MVEQEVLGELEEQNQKLSVKELADRLKRPQSSLYRLLRRLVENGLVWKSQKLVKGKLIAVYSVPSKTGIKPCGWKEHKEILLLNKEYTDSLLEFDFGPALREEIASLRQRDETLDVLISGLKGIGKSVSALSLAHRLDPQFSVRRNVILNKKRLLELAVAQPLDTAFLLDDLGTTLSSRAWAEPERAIVFDFFSICRQNRVHLIGTSPSPDLVDIYFRRLVRYLMIVTLRCQDHVHIIIHRKTDTAGERLHFRPVGTLTLPYPLLLDPFIKEYELLKKSELRGSAKDWLEQIEQAKQKLQNYVLTHPISHLTEDHFQAGLIAIGLDGAISKHDRTILRSAMFTALEEKRYLERETKKTQTETNKTTLKISKQQSALSKQQSAYTKKFQGYLDQGKDEAFARTLAQRETQKKMNPDHWKKVISASKAIQKRGIESNLIDRFILQHIDDPYLVVALKQRNEILDEFRGFPKDFITKLWVMIDTDPMKAKKFIGEVLALKDSFLYKDKKGKFSPQKWQESVLARLNLLEAGERRKLVEEERERAEQERWERIAHNVGNVGKFIGGLFRK